MPTALRLPPSGIYALVNQESRKLYIGSSVRVPVRVKVHFRDLRFNRHHSDYLQRAFNREPQAFYPEVIEELPPVKALLLEREEFWMRFYGSWEGSLYNEARKPSSCLGVKHGDETRRKMSDAAKRYAETGRCRPVVQFDIAGNFVKYWPSVQAAETELFGARKGIADACGGRNTHCGGFQWRYADELILKPVGAKPPRRWRTSNADA